MIRRLANRIKHHESTIVSGTSRDADALIEQFGFPDGFHIGSWSRGATTSGPNPCRYFNLYGIQCFCIGAINHFCNVKFPLPDWAEDEVKEKLVQQWLGDFIELESRQGDGES